MTETPLLSGQDGVGAVTDTSRQGRAIGTLHNDLVLPKPRDAEDRHRITEGDGGLNGCGGGSQLFSECVVQVRLRTPMLGRRTERQEERKGDDGSTQNRGDRTADHAD